MNSVPTVSQGMFYVQVMGKLIRNAAVSPSEDKFKRIKLSNSKVKTTIVDIPGGVQSLLAMGWTHDEVDKDFLVLPKGTQMSMKEVRHLSKHCSTRRHHCICLSAFLGCIPSCRCEPLKKQKTA